MQNMTASDRNAKDIYLTGEVSLVRMQNWSCRALISAGLLLLSSSLAWGASPHAVFLQCNEPGGIFCAEQRDNPGGKEY